VPQLITQGEPGMFGYRCGVRVILNARTALALLAGVALSAAFAPISFPPVIVGSIALLILVTRGLSARRALLPGFAFGVGFQVTLLLWMRAIGTDAWLALSLVEATFFAGLGSVFAILGRHRLWPCWCAAAWVAIELLRSSWPFGGLPWGRLGFASIDTPIAAWLPYVGTTGTTLVWAMMGSALAWTALLLRKRPVVAVLAAAAAIGFALLPNLSTYDVTTDGSLTVAAVQGDVPGDGTDVLFDHRQVTANHVNATIQLADDAAASAVPTPDLVVWPENSTAVDPFLDAGVNAGITAASRAIDAPILVGGIVQGEAEDEILNQGIVWTPDIGAGDRYTKRHPVAYGEYIPFREQLPFSANFGRLREIGRDMVAGTRSKPLQVAGVRVADAICFDVAYDDGIYEQVRQGSDLLVVQTSNAMFVNTAQLEQQFAISRVRAVETGRQVVVAATNGISGVIDRDGTVRERAAIRTQDTVVETISLTRAVPPGIRVSPVLGWLCWGTAALGLGLSLAPAVSRAREESGRSFGPIRVSSET
jgi:apolipoprotein N-acyltransferase